MKNKNNIFLIIILIIIILLGIYVGYGYYKKATHTIQHPIATMEIENFGTVKMELYPEFAPNTVANFVKLINEGYYNGLTFHRVEESLIQGGDKQGDGTGKSEVTIPGEFSANDYTFNTLKFEKGVVGLARADYSAYASYGRNVVEEGYNSGYSQFFIMTDYVASFNGYYTGFGKVIEGIEIVEEISKLETEIEKDEESGTESATTKPINPPVIKSMTVDTLEVNYENPKTQPYFDINNWIMTQLYGG